MEHQENSNLSYRAMSSPTHGILKNKTGKTCKELRDLRDRGGQASPSSGKPTHGVGWVYGSGDSPVDKSYKKALSFKHDEATKHVPIIDEEQKEHDPKRRVLD